MQEKKEVMMQVDPGSGTMPYIKTNPCKVNANISFDDLFQYAAGGASSVKGTVFSVAGASQTKREAQTAGVSNDEDKGTHNMRLTELYRESAEKSKRRAIEVLNALGIPNAEAIVGPMIGFVDINKLLDRLLPKEELPKDLKNLLERDRRMATEG